MVDPGHIVREWLLANSAVTSLLGTQTGQAAASLGIVVGDLPENFTVEVGPGIQLLMSGGPGDSEITPLVTPRVTVKVWALPNQQKLARQVFRACYDQMHGTSMVDFGADGRIVSCSAQDTGQDITDPTGWTSVVGVFGIQIVQTSGISTSDFASSTLTVAQYIASLGLPTIKKIILQHTISQADLDLATANSGFIYLQFDMAFAVPFPDRNYACFISMETLLRSDIENNIYIGTEPFNQTPNGASVIIGLFNTCPLGTVIYIYMLGVQ